MSIVWWKSDPNYFIRQTLVFLLICIVLAATTQGKTDTHNEHGKTLSQPSNITSDSKLLTSNNTTESNNSEMLMESSKQNVVIDRSDNSNSKPKEGRSESRSESRNERRIIRVDGGYIMAPEESFQLTQESTRPIPSTEMFTVSPDNYNFPYHNPDMYGMIPLKPGERIISPAEFHSLNSDTYAPSILNIMKIPAPVAPPRISPTFGFPKQRTPFPRMPPPPPPPMIHLTASASRPFQGFHTAPSQNVIHPTSQPRRENTRPNILHSGWPVIPPNRFSDGTVFGQRFNKITTPASDAPQSQTTTQTGQDDSSQEYDDYVEYDDPPTTTETSLKAPTSPPATTTTFKPRAATDTWRPIGSVKVTPTHQIPKEDLEKPTLSPVMRARFPFLEKITTPKPNSLDRFWNLLPVSTTTRNPGGRKGNGSYVIHSGIDLEGLPTTPTSYIPDNYENNYVDDLDASSSNTQEQQRFKLTTANLAYILIGSCCGLSIISLVVVAVTIRVKSVLERQRMKRKLEIHHSARQVSNSGNWPPPPSELRNPVDLEPGMNPQRRNGSVCSSSFTCNSYRCGCGTWTLGTRNLSTVQVTNAIINPQSCSVRRGLPFGAGSTCAAAQTGPTANESDSLDSINNCTLCQEGQQCTCVTPPKAIPIVKKQNKEVCPKCDQNSDAMFWTSNDERLI